LKILFFLGSANPFPGAGWTGGGFAKDWVRKGQNRNDAIRYVLERLKAELDLGLRYESFFESRTSYLYKFKSYSVDTPKEITIKLYKISKSMEVDASPSENGSIFLEQLADTVFDIRDVVIPRLIMHLPMVNGIVMEWVDGMSLQKLISLCGRFGSKNERERLECLFTKVSRVIGLIQARTYKPNTGKPKLYLNAKFEKIKSQIDYSYPRTTFKIC